MKIHVDGCRIDGKQGATILIDKDRLIVTVRPHWSRTLYTVTLAEMAEMVAWRAAKKKVKK